MTRTYKPIDPSQLRTYSQAQRQHKASVTKVAALPQPGASAAQLIDSFPDQLGAAAFRGLVSAVVQAVRHERPVVVAFGAHVLKVGCGPILVDLMRRGVISAIAGNGACAIHDVELAIAGETSEDVAETIHNGMFGMVRETLTFFDDVAILAAKQRIGLGDAVGRLLRDRKAPHADQSVYAVACALGIPATSHVALGTDTVHMSAGADGAAIGAASMHDFRLICDVVADLGARPDSDVGGVWLNIGSAVVMPEVFLKAVSIARNLGADLDSMNTANLDMIRHYRPHQNVVTRPVRAGHGFEIIGQHEIILPLFRQAVLEGLSDREQTS